VDKPRKPRGPGKHNKGTTSQRVQRKRRMDEATKRSKHHQLEWVDFVHGVCADCGIMLHLIQTTMVGKAGWQMKDVWGGDDNGIGGSFNEPPCRSADR
jgi:hypothetical protein